MKLPLCFHAGGVICGISAKKKKKDLALFYSEKNCAAAGLFTKNLVSAAPVQVSRKNLAGSRDSVRAVIVNSGCANACTGIRGIRDANTMCELTASRLGLASRQVLVASTGVIGVHLPMHKIADGINPLCDEVKSGTGSAGSAVEAIMTTDTFPKKAEEEVSLGGKKIRIWGCAKGAGMIHPDMATLLSFILADADITAGALKTAIVRAAERTFNSISVDGDTSTNDTLIALANGAAGNNKIKSVSENDGRKFAGALESVCRELALMVARDGEGATKLIKIRVHRSKDEKTARKVAVTVATSPLVKTAAFGNDPNWGRIIAAVGRSGAKIVPSKIDIGINGTLVCRGGQSVNFSETVLKKKMSVKNLQIDISLNSGDKWWEYDTCDFSFDYVRINACYRT